MTPLSVLHVHSGNLYGGLETFLTTLAREAAVAPGMASSFALCFEGRCADELKAFGHRPHMLGSVRISRPHTIWRGRQRLRKLLAEQRFDVVVCHQAWAYAIFGPTVRHAGLPLVFWQHTAGDGRHWLERWARRFNPDLVVANSQFAAGRVSRWFTGARVETVYCALRPIGSASLGFPSRQDIRRSLATSPDDLVIIQVGRLESQKGNLEALDALGTLRNLAGWTYWIVGGPQRASDRRYLGELKNVVLRKGIGERVRFAGERRDVGVLMEAADIYCQPNIEAEPFGISLVEAQCAGLPIVASALGGAIEIVDEACGLLISPRDIEGLASALRDLITNPVLRGHLGRASRNRADTFCDIERQMQRMEALLSDTIETKTSAMGCAASTQPPTRQL